MNQKSPMTTRIDHVYWMVTQIPETHRQIQAQFERMSIEALPTIRTELTGFFTVSITAGICEEILFRGYLPFYLAEYADYWSGMVLATVIFSAIHLYLGVTGAVRALLAGSVFVALFAWTGSLLPGMLLHAVVDLASGWMAYVVLKGKSPAAMAAD